MGTKTVFYTFDTDRPIEYVKDAARRSLMMLGGTMQDLGEMILINQGTVGVSNAFTADFTANVNIRQVAQQKYEVFCTINWKPNALMWICLIVGFFVFGILWVIPLLYLFVDPANAYQQALYRIPPLIQ